MTIYDDMQDVAGDLFNDFKQGEVSLILTTPGVGTEDAPGTPTEVSHSLDATVKGVSFGFVQSGLAVETDLVVTSAVIENITPDSNDFIEIDGNRYKIIQDVSVPASGTKVAWKFIVRKGG